MSSIRLVYAAHDVTLNNPKFGNTQNLANARVQRESRGGTQQVYRDSSWPSNESFHIEVEGVSESDRDDFLALVEDSLGKIVQLTDHESNVRTGLITSPRSETTEFLRDCGYTISFDFEET